MRRNGREVEIDLKKGIISDHIWELYVGEVLEFRVLELELELV
jgi:hypothetical protein